MTSAPTISNPTRWFYAYSEDAEWWRLGGETRAEAEAKALTEAEEDDEMFVLEARRMVPSLTEIVLADNVIDSINDDECWGEDGWEGSGDPAELQRRLDATIAQWFTECCTLDGAQLDFVTGPERVGG